MYIIKDSFEEDLNIMENTNNTFIVQPFEFKLGMNKYLYLFNKVYLGFYQDSRNYNSPNSLDYDLWNINNSKNIFLSDWSNYNFNNFNDTIENNEEIDEEKIYYITKNKNKKDLNENINKIETSIQKKEENNLTISGTQADEKRLNTFDNQTKILKNKKEEKNIIEEDEKINLENISSIIIEIKNDDNYLSEQKNIYKKIPYLKNKKIFFKKQPSSGIMAPSKEENNLPKNYSTKFINKKRKREIKSIVPTNDKQRIKRIHDIFSSDNLLKKIRIHFLNFCIEFINNFVQKKFLKINYDFKKNAKEAFTKELKRYSLGDIINREISSKYIKFNEKYNKNIYEEYEHHEILKKIFSLKFEILFKFYWNNNRIINLKGLNIGLNEEILKKYNLKKEIKLSEDVEFFNDIFDTKKTYKDLLKTNKSLAIKYRKEMINCCFRNFYHNPIFIIN